MWLALWRSVADVGGLWWCAPVDADRCVVCVWSPRQGQDLACRRHDTRRS